MSDVKKPSVVFETPPESWDEKTMAVALAMCGTGAEVARKVGVRPRHVDIIFDGTHRVALDWNDDDKGK